MNPAWLRCFQAAWFIGFLGGGLLYYLICLLSPPSGRPYIRESFGNENEDLIDGINGDGTNTPKDLDCEKGANTNEVKTASA